MSLPQEFETRPIPQLLWSYALPAIVGQLISSIYNIADRIILGQYVGPLAIAGLAITLPIMNIIHAFGSLVGAGSAARLSIVLGRKDIRWAEKILGNSMLLTFFFGFLFVTGGYLFMDAILSAFGASADTLAYARTYMKIVLPGMFFTTLAFNLTGLIRSSGYPTKSMWILAGGALLNIVLDLLFITLFHWGIAGAAWATTIAMAVASVFAVWHFVPKWGAASGCLLQETEATEQVFNGKNRKTPVVVFRSHSWEPKGYIIRNILAIGISPFLMNVAASGVAIVINHQLLRFGGDIAVGIYGIINSSSLIIFLLLMGICQGMQPIAGYNYGAGHTQRLRQVYRLTMWVCLVAGALGTVACCCFPQLILRCFTTDAQLIQFGVPAMRYLTIMFMPIAFTVINSQFFQSIDKPWIAIVTSLSRQVLFLVPMMFLVPWLFVRGGGDGLTGVWFSCTLSDVFGALLSAVLLFSQRAVFRDGYQPPLRRPNKERGPQGVAVLLVLILLSQGVVWAQADGSTQSSPKGLSVSHVVLPVPQADSALRQAAYPRIGVVLGGGGAKGAAHVGVLRYLEEHNIPIHCIAGTSMGAIVGGFYALGYSAAQLDTIISNINWSAYLGGSVDRATLSASARKRSDPLIISIPISLRASDSVRYAHISSFVGGSSLTNLFNNLSVGYQDSCSFDSLPIPFACVATNLCNGDEVVLRSGNLPQAIRASMAIPGVFDPVTMGDKMLADGGMVNNFPVDVCRAMGADIVIGVEVGDSLSISADQLASLPQLVGQLMSVVVSGKTAINRQSCDIYIRPDISGYSILSFNAAAIDTLVRRGYEAAARAMDTITFSFPQSTVRCAASASRVVNLYNDSVQLHDINFHGVAPIQRTWLMRHAGLEEGRVVTAADLDRSVEYLTATAAYRNITYRVHRIGLRGDTMSVIGGVNQYDRYNLDITLQPTPPHTVGLGFRYDTEESAFLLLDVGLLRNRLSGTRVDLSARLSYNPRLYAAVSFIGFARGTATLDYRFASTEYTLIETSGNQQFVDYEDHRFRLYLSDFNFTHLNVLGGAQFRQMHYRSLLGDTLSLPSCYGNNTLSFFLSGRFDNLDAPIYACRGSYLLLNLAGGADGENNGMPTFRHNRWSAASVHAATYISPGGSIVTIVPAFSFRWVASSDSLYRYHRNLVGGVMAGRYVDQQLSFLGTLTPYVVGNAALILRCDLRVRIGGHHNLALIGNCLYHNTTLKQFLHFKSDSSCSEFGAALRYAYTTRFGPISVDIASSTLHPKPQFYLSFGYNF